MPDDTIRWPARYHPDNSAVHVVNELQMSASSEAIWEQLIRAKAWPDWYPNSENVQFRDPDAQALSEGARFRW